MITTDKFVIGLLAGSFISSELYKLGEMSKEEYTKSLQDSLGIVTEILKEEVIYHD